MSFGLPVVSSTMCSNTGRVSLTEAALSFCFILNVSISLFAMLDEKWTELLNFFKQDYYMHTAMKSSTNSCLAFDALLVVSLCFGGANLYHITSPCFKGVFQPMRATLQRQPCDSYSTHTLSKSKMDKCFTACHFTLLKLANLEMLLMHLIQNLPKFAFDS